MDNTYFGKIIIDRRRELDMKQEDLCRGICSRQTLSRIESGRHKPSRFIAEALLTRLDLPVSYYINQPTYEEYMQILLHEKIADAIRIGEFEKLPALVAESRQHIDDNKYFEQQIMRAQAVYALHVEKDIENSRKILTDAISLVHPDFSVDTIEKMHLSRDEYNVLNMLANTYSEEDDYEMVIRIFRKLVENIKNRPDVDSDEEISRFLIMFQYNLSRALGRLDYYKECYEIADEAIERHMRVNRLTRLIELLVNKGYGLCAIKRKEEGTLVLKDALDLCRITDHKEYDAIIRKDALELFGIEL